MKTTEGSGRLRKKETLYESKRKKIKRNNKGSVPDTLQTQIKKN